MSTFAREECALTSILLAESATLRGHAAALAKLAGANGSVRFARTTGRSPMTALVGPDPSSPGQYRITRFDADGPVGHTCFFTQEEALWSAVVEGFEPQSVHPTETPA